MRHSEVKKAGRRMVIRMVMRHGLQLGERRRAATGPCRQEGRRGRRGFPSERRDRAMGRRLYAVSLTAERIVLNAEIGIAADRDHDKTIAFVQVRDLPIE